MPAVLNASALIHLARLAKLRPALEEYGTLHVPVAVYVEVVETGKKEGYPDAFTVERMQVAGSICVERLGKEGQGVARELAEAIGEGEAQAIALARERAWPLLIDDDEGRRIARFYNVETLTTLGAVFQLAVDKHIPAQEYVTNVRRYAAMGWITGDVVDRYLQEVRRLE